MAVLRPALPGVGRKTANVILNTLYKEPTLAVDTHIFRLAHRLGLSQASTPEGVEKDLLPLIPDAYKLNAHHWFILALTRSFELVPPLTFSFTNPLMEALELCGPSNTAQATPRALQPSS